jgi:crossover junction endodeoxyribonuclease RuvC
MQRPRLVEVQDMPIKLIRGKYKVDAAEIAAMVRRLMPGIIAIEGVGSRPGEGHVGAFSFGYCAGLLEGVGAGLGVTVRILPAASWKRYAGVPSDKDECRRVARGRWPEFRDFFSRGKDHDRADAALLAEWAAKNLRINKSLRIH